MNALIVSTLAASSASLSNLFFRKSSEHSASKDNFNYYLLVFYFFSLCLSIIINPTIWETSWNALMMGLGACVGILNVIMMLLTSEALKRGPAGLTFLFQNISCIFPGVLLFILFGPAFGFQVTYYQMLGLGIVIFGLILATRGSKRKGKPMNIKWLKYALACFFVQTFILSFIQWRCLLFSAEKPKHILIPWAVDACYDAWFMPGMFGAAFIFQMGIVFFDKRQWSKSELIFGALGGCANGIATALLLLATQWATPMEKGILFPCFAATTIILCNVWAKKLYQEKFNLPANLACAIGILIGAFA